MILCGLYVGIKPCDREGKKEVYLSAQKNDEGSDRNLCGCRSGAERMLQFKRVAVWKRDQITIS